MVIENSFFSVILNVILPSFVIFFFSESHLLGPTYSFLLALVFPLTYGIIYLLLKNKWNLFSLIGLVSVLLTGGFGLFELEAGWLIAKETAIPLIIGIVILISQRTKNPVMKFMLSQVIDLDQVAIGYRKNKKTKLLSKHINYANIFFAITFFVGALLNFILATIILQSSPGTSEYAREVGTLAALAFPAIVLPVMILIFGIFTMMAIFIEKSTGKSITVYMK